MSQIPAVYLQYFDAMQPGQILAVDSAKDQAALILYARQYIDNTGTLEFNPDYSRIKKIEAFTHVHRTNDN